MSQVIAELKASGIPGIGTTLNMRNQYVRALAGAAATDPVSMSHLRGKNGTITKLLVTLASAGGNLIKTTSPNPVGPLFGGIIASLDNNSDTTSRTCNLNFVSADPTWEPPIAFSIQFYPSSDPTFIVGRGIVSRVGTSNVWRGTNSLNTFCPNAGTYLVDIAPFL